MRMCVNKRTVTRLQNLSVRLTSLFPLRRTTEIFSVVASFRKATSLTVNLDKLFVIPQAPFCDGYAHMRLHSETQS